MDIDIYKDVAKLVWLPSSHSTIFCRLSEEEKQHLEEIAFALRDRAHHGTKGTRINENTLVRIAVDYLLLDYETNGEQSALLNVVSWMER